MYSTAIKKPMPGIDRPKGADDSWRPSIMDHVRLACIAMSFENSKNRQPQINPSLSCPWRDGRYTPGQLEQVMILRKFMRAQRSSQQQEPHP